MSAFFCGKYVCVFLWGIFCEFLREIFLRFSAGNTSASFCRKSFLFTYIPIYMKNILLSVILLASTLSIWQGCVSTYQPMSLDDMPLDTDWNAIDDPHLHMAIDYEVLTEPGMKRYAAMERKNKVNLVAVTIHNTGFQDFVISQDALFHLDGNSIVPLSLDDAMNSLIEPITDKEKDPSVEVDVPSSWDLIWGAGKVANQTKTVVSHVRFASDMSEHYLVDSILSPGTMTRGLLVLPVIRGNMVSSSLRQ